MIVKQPTAELTRLDSSLLRVAAQAQASDGRLDQVAASLGLSSEEEALAAVAATMGLDMVDLSQVEVEPELLESFPVKLIHHHEVFPLVLRDNDLVLATSNPFNVHAIDAVSAATGWTVTPVVALPDELSKLIKSYLGVGAETIDGLLAAITEATAAAKASVA